MKIWLNRIFALALISLGISMIFLPFNDTRSGSVGQEIVLLQKIKLLNPDEISMQFPAMEIKDITGPELNPDDYPKLFGAFVNLGEDWINESTELMEWTKFQNLVLQSNSEFCLVVFREGLISCLANKNQKAEEVVLFTYLGKYNPNIKQLSETDLSNYHTINNAIHELETPVIADAETVKIPIDEWDQMVGEYLDPITDSHVFNYKGNFYEPEFQWDTIIIKGEISGLKISLKIMGVLFAFIGFLLIRKLYNRKHGLWLSSQKKTILFDIISLAFFIPAAYTIVNTVLKMALFIPSIVKDDFIIIIGNFFFCVGIPIVALLTSRLTSQTE